jgi:3-oxoacyl-(acyl-carrier-protein) synthase
VLGVTSPFPCRPFDSARAGLNLGEGAAYLVLETEESAKRRGVKAQAMLSGYGNACDAFHQTASSPDGEGAYRAMKEAMELADIQPNEIDYINAHGTGTPNNDLSESRAVMRLFGDNMPPMSSTKPFTGHTTSASGSIEAVFCILALQHGFVPANLNWSQPMDDGITPVHQPVKKKLNHVLCNAFGFGGNDSSLLISRADDVCHRLDTLNVQPVYVLSAKQISVQQPLNEDWKTQPIEYQSLFNRSIDPSFKEYISPIEARRMGKILKRAIATSKEAMKASGLDSVDAIITGTGYGCIENTEVFLDALSKEGEQMLSPTYFMQSTHNTISSLVAIQLKNHGYNVTYAHKGISFDSAIQDAWIQMQLGKIKSALVGGHDEMTETFYSILKKGSVMGQDEEMCSEAAMSVVLGTEKRDSLCKLVNFKMLHKPSMDTLKAVVKDFQADYVLTGISGNHKSDEAYLNECKDLFGNSILLKYKHLFGESFTSSGIGMYVAAHCLKAGNIPAHLFVNKDETKGKKPHKILIFNHTDGNNYSLTLLEA